MLNELSLLITISSRAEEYKIMFLNQLNEYLNENASDPDISIELLSRQFYMSRSQFYRKIKSHTNQSPIEYLRNYRLDQSLILLKERKGKISDVAMAVGIADPKYFSRCFRKRFGVPPSKIQNERNVHSA